MFKKVVHYSPSYLRLLRRASSLTETVISAAERVVKKRPEKKPFIKNLLAGSYDEEFLIYPELTSENLKVVDTKYLALPKKLTSLRDSFKQIIQAVDNQDFGMVVGEMNKNRLSELTKLSEAIPSLPLSLLLEIHRICVHQIISKYCNEEQKKKYLPGLLKGEISVAFAMSEENSGSDPSSITTTAVRDDESSKWTLNGVKSWVTNAEYSDLFLVFSKVKLKNKSSESMDLAVFLVDRKSKGVMIEKISNYGLEDCGIAKIILNNVSLSDNDIISQQNDGYTIASELINSYKYSLSSCFSSQLKSLLNETVKFISPRKQSLRDLKDCESIRKRLSDVFLTIYTLDSMLYLTAGMMDNFEIDMTIESAAIHLYCIQNGVLAFEKCLEMLGSQAYDDSLPYSRLRRDLKAISTVLHSKDICKLYVALNGIQHATNIMSSDVHKVRNAFNYPAFFINKLISNRRNLKDSPKLNLNLFMNLHPSLQNSCSQLEYCVLRLQYCLEYLLSQHGSELSNRQLDLERISDVILDIYGMTAVLGRASRAYCTGIKFADDEMLLAKAFCFDAFLRCKTVINSMLEGYAMAADLNHLKLADHLVQRDGYFIEHPLTQNIG